MPALQIKECPQDVYDQLKVCAIDEDRTISGEMLAIIKWYLALREQGLIACAAQPSVRVQASPAADASARRAAFERIAALPEFMPASDGVTTTDLLRESREEAR